MEACILDIKQWMCHNLLKLNDSKTEVLFITSPHFQGKIPQTNLLVDTSSVFPSQSARNIGVLFDNTCQMKCHVKSIYKISMCQIRAIGSIRRYITADACATLVHCFISTRLDYCNALLAQLPHVTLKPLQHIQNIAARLITKVKKQEHISPILQSLHWLPIAQRIKFKVLILVFKSLHQEAPAYLQKLVIPYKPPRDLRSVDTATLIVPRVKTGYGERSFAACGPKFWNDLPLDIRKMSDLDAFKTAVKTFLFKEAFFNLHT